MGKKIVVLLFTLSIFIVAFGTARHLLTAVGLHLMVRPLAVHGDPVHKIRRIVDYNTEEGIRLHGLYYPPLRVNAPVIIICHGNAQNMYSFGKTAISLRESGFAVLSFDYRSNISAFTDLSKDLKASMAFVSHQPYLDSSRIGLLGLSLGTAPAIRLAAEDRRIKALILHGSIFSGERLINSKKDKLLSFCARYLVNLNGLDNASKIAKIRCPLMMIIEAEDTVTPSTDGLELYRLAPQPKTLWFVPSVGHLGIVRNAPETYQARIIKFFDTYLK